MTPLLDAVAAEMTAKTNKNSAKWWQYVRLMADGREAELKPAEVAGLLEALHKTPADLAKDIAHLLNRRKLRASIAESEKLSTELGDTLKKIEVAKSTFAAAKEKFKSTIEPLESRETQLRSAISMAAEYPRRLRTTCNDPELIRLHAAVTDRLSDAHQAVNKINAHMKLNAAAYRDPARASAVQNYSERLSQLRSEIAAGDAELADIERRMAASEI